MGRYRTIYTCLICKKTMAIGEPVTISDENVREFVRRIADPYCECKPIVPIVNPTHNCRPWNDKIIGACIFAGFELDEEEDNNDCE